MDRWQLWRRVWFRLNRKNQRRRHYAVATRTRSDPEGQRSTAAPPRYLLGRQHFSFVSDVLTMAAGITQRPKVLLDVDCSDLLMGGSQEYENFSSTCWLEDHLHRFGEPAQAPQENETAVDSSYEFHGSTELEASTSGSSGVLGDSFDFGVVESSDQSEEEGVGTSGGSDSLYTNANIINLHRYPYVDTQAAIPEPPPYQDEPPPSYEEAIAGSSFNPDDSTDFLW